MKGNFTFIKPFISLIQLYYQDYVRRTSFYSNRYMIVWIYVYTRMSNLIKDVTGNGAQLFIQKTEVE